MTSLTRLLLKWPLLRQIREREDGTGLESMSDKTRAIHARTDGAKVARSICPYCAVGCGQLIYHSDGKPISIEGDPESPIGQGHLCPKGAASYQLLTHARRETKMKYRAPRSKDGWRFRSIDMDMVADRVGNHGSARSCTKRWRYAQSHDGDLPSRWGNSRQRRELSHPKIFHSWPGDGVHIQPGADMT